MSEKIFYYCIDLPQLSSWIEDEVKRFLKYGYSKEQVSDIVFGEIYGRITEKFFEKLKENDDYIKRRIRETIDGILKKECVAGMS